MNKSDKVGRSTAAIADDDGHRWRVGDVFQHGAHRVRAAFYHQAHHGGGGVCVWNNGTVINVMYLGIESKKGKVLIGTCQRTQ